MPAESSTSAVATGVAATATATTPTPTPTPTTTTTLRGKDTATFSNKDVFISLPSLQDESLSSSSGAERRRRTLVFMIPGNPGLIEYYQEFLSRLRDGLRGEEGPQAGSGAVAVAGLSLGGFEVDDELGEHWARDVQAPRRDHDGHGSRRRRRQAWGNDRGLFGLQEQIDLCHARVEAIVGLMGGGGSSSNSDPGVAQKDKEHVDVDVILIGHSVGAYIALEVVKLWNERRRRRTEAEAAAAAAWTPKAALLLMPTLIDLHKSRSGRLATPILSTVPFVPEFLQSAATGLGYALPPAWLTALVSKVTGMKEGQAGLETTVNFVASVRGVNEALHLARDELAQIRANKWGEDVWGGGVAGNGPSPSLYFLFAQQDHWVADESRKEIVEVRGVNARRMLIDREEGLAHAWPLRSTEPVVKLVLPWVKQVLLEANTTTTTTTTTTATATAAATKTR